MKSTLSSIICTQLVSLSCGLSGATSTSPIQQNETPVEFTLPNKLHVSWDEYNEKTNILAKKIHESGWEFDQVICIARGGMFIGDPLSRLFDKPLAIISASSYRADGGTMQDKLIISKRIAMNTPSLHPRILLVDDMVDSGVTLREVKKAIEDQYPEVKEIRTAVIWRKSHTQYEADYIVDEVDGQLWIVQPFEIYDNMKIED